MDEKKLFEKSVLRQHVTNYTSKRDIEITDLNSSAAESRCTLKLRSYKKNNDAYSNNVLGLLIYDNTEYIKKYIYTPNYAMYVIRSTTRRIQVRVRGTTRNPAHAAACAYILPFRQYRTTFTRVNRSCARTYIYISI